MYRFESEECNGPGISSKLDWAIRRFQVSPNEDTYKHLKLELDIVIAKNRRFIKQRKDSVELAQELLKNTS